MRFEREGRRCRWWRRRSSARACRSSRPPSCPRAAFTDSGVLDWELAPLFRGGWVCAGHVDQVRERGDFLTVEIGGDSVLVVGDDDGLPRAFLNVCRHRGARLVDAARGPHAPPAVPLPRVDLRLRRQRCATRRSPTAWRTSTRRASACTQVRLAVVEGLVLLDLSGEAPPPQEHVGDLAALLAALPARRAAARRADRLRRRRQLEGDRRELQRVPALPGRAPGAQPPLALPVAARTIEGAGAWCGGSMTLAEGVETMATDGGHGRPPIDGRRATCARSSTSCSSRTRWSRCTPTT